MLGTTVPMPATPTRAVVHLLRPCIHRLCCVHVAVVVREHSQVDVDVDSL